MHRNALRLALDHSSRRAFLRRTCGDGGAGTQAVSAFGHPFPQPRVFRVLHPSRSLPQLRQPWPVFARNSANIPVVPSATVVLGSLFVHAGVCPKAKSWAAAPQANNNHEQLVECSNKGKCDRKGGECECHAGFTGEACDRTVCPNDCSGHGTCQSLKHFADDYSHDADDSMVSVQFGIPSSNPNTVPNTGAVYDNAWDATKSFGCKCDNGFQGADCSLRACPSGTDPLGGEGSSEGRECSGRGTCDFSSGLCNCFAGYFGEKCQTQNTIA